jgi:hypothetical protein
MKTKVYMIESERGWGQKVDEVKVFPTREEAVKFAEEYNKKYNPPGPVPDWYIRAEVEDDN